MRLEDRLHVVTAISNPVRYRSRYALYREFAKRVADQGATLTTIELALGERPFEITTADCHGHVQVRTKHELWHKENLLNLAVNRLPPAAQYIAWIDADVTFARPDWAGETIHQLQHFHFVQMFSHAQDVGPDFQPLSSHIGFAFAHHHGLLRGCPRRYASHWHPGYAWAARRSALDKVGGLIDWAVLGAADTHMAMALIGQVRRSLQPGMSKPYVEELLRWQERAVKHIRRNIGHVPGLLLHHWHGKKRNRRYADRWQVLTKNQFDPREDLKRDAQGVWQLTDRSSKLRDDIRRYFRSRHEDSIDVE